jgi:hypothetical protein
MERTQSHDVAVANEALTNDDRLFQAVQDDMGSINNIKQTTAEGQNLSGNEHLPALNLFDSAEESKVQNTKSNEIMTGDEKAKTEKVAGQNGSGDNSGNAQRDGVQDPPATANAPTDGAPAKSTKQAPAARTPETLQKTTPAGPHPGAKIERSNKATPAKQGNLYDYQHTSGTCEQDVFAQDGARSKNILKTLDKRFDEIDKDKDQTVTAAEIAKYLARRDTDLTPQERTELQLVAAQEEELANLNRDNIFLPEKGITRADMAKGQKLRLTLNQDDMREAFL